MPQLTDFNDPDAALARADLALREARLAHEIQALNKKRLALDLPPVRLDLRLSTNEIAPLTAGIDAQADRCVTSEDLAPALQRDPREVASIIRSVLDSLEFINKAVAFAEAVDGYRFQEGSKISDTHFVRERVALLWCASVLIGETDVPPPNDFCSTYYSASNRVAS